MGRICRCNVTISTGCSSCRRRRNLLVWGAPVRPERQEQQGHHLPLLRLRPPLPPARLRLHRRAHRRRRRPDSRALPGYRAQRGGQNADRALPPRRAGSDRRGQGQGSVLPDDAAYQHRGQTTLLHAHYEGAVPLDLLKEEQAELSTELNQIERQLAAYQADAAEVRQYLTQALDLLEDCHRLYTAAPAHLKKLLNQVFFDRVLVNPLVDEDGWVILPDQGDGVTDSGKQPGKDAGAHDGQYSAGEERTGDANGGGGADADTPILMPRPVHLADTGSGARLSALLVPPFDQLISPSLHAAAHTHHLHHPAQPGASATPPTADDTLMSSTTRTTPTPVGERCSSSGTASQTFLTGVGLGKSLLVPEGGLEPPRPLVGH